MKFVYVLVSSANDFYAEQSAVSIYSLKKYNQDAEISIICDPRTYDYLKKTKAYLWDMAEMIPVATPQGYTNLQKSRFLKTSLRQLIDGDIVFIDGDTIITGSLDELKTFDCDLGAVKVQDTNFLNKGLQHPSFKNYNRNRHLPEDFNYGLEHYFNSGVIVCKDSLRSREFYKTWHSLWQENNEQYGDPHDQCDFDRTNSIYENVVKELEGIYNLGAPYPLVSYKYLEDCRIFHYFSSSNNLNFLRIKDPEFLLRFRKEGITCSTDKMIENIKGEYLQGIKIILTKEDRDSFLERGARYVSRVCPKLNTTLEKTYTCLKKIFRGKG